MRERIVGAVQILAFIVGFFLIFDAAKGDPDMTVVNQICNGFKYPACDNFGANIIEVLKDLEKNTPNQGYNYYASSPDADGTKCYGHAACNFDLTPGDCLACLSYVNNYIIRNCFLRVGVQLEVADCGVRYEQYPFTE